MNRGHFLSLSLLTGLGASLPLSAAQSLVPHNLRSWVKTHKVVVQKTPKSLSMTANIPLRQLSDCLQDLSQLCEGHLQAVGNNIRGRCNGQAFSLVLS